MKDDNVLSNADSPIVSLSIVVVTVYTSAHLINCLSGLDQQVGAPKDIEIIVVCHEGIENMADLKKRFPKVEFHRVSGPQTQDTLRAYGVTEARGNVVAITVDHCVPEKHWSANIVKAHEGPYAAVGGAIERGTQPDTLVNRAIHLYDYCNYAYYQNPIHPGPARDLSDCNASYKRRALIATANLRERKFNVAFINKTLLDLGETLWLSPDIVVHQNRSARLGRAARIAYRRGRAFASSRMASSTSSQRIFYSLFSPLLPLMFWKRLAVNLQQKSLLGSSLGVLPFIGFFTILWSFGEFIGYLAGRPNVTLAVSDE